jgi:ADP-heptose:LPS heptosyltransferase
MRLSSLGDIVLSTSAVEPLRRAGYEVFYVTKKAFASLLEGNPDIAGVYAFDKAGGEGAARESFLRWCDEKNLSLVIDLQDSWRTWGWRRALRAKAPVFVARKERLREWLILYLRLGAWAGFGRGGRAKKFRRATLDALAAAGEFPAAPPALTTLHVSDEERAQVAPLLPPGDFAVLLPASAWKGKEWPYFPELAAVLARKVPVVVLGAEKDFICDEVARKAMAVNPLSRSLRGQTSLRQSLAVVAAARWVIGNDTGLVHAGEALGRDVAMVEGPTHKRMGFSPYRERSVLLGLNLICRPCSKTGRICPRFGTYKCLNDLTVAGVAESLRRRGYPC